MSLRDDFEKLFPVPHPAKWSEHLGCYSPEYQSDPALANLAVRVANSHNVLWQGFQAGHAAGLEAAAKYVEDEGYAGLPIGIRAMKP